MSEEQFSAFEDWAEENEVEDLPQIILPSAEVTITDCATKLYKLIAPTKQLFMRGGAAVRLMRRDDGLLMLEILRPSAARSFFEKFGRFFGWRVGANNVRVLQPVNCAQEMADALLQSEEAANLLPRVRGLMNCPVIVELDGKLTVARPGYDENTKLLITGGETPPVVELSEAVVALLELFVDFDFQSDADKARAISTLIAPALKAGGFLRGRVPADVSEADQSQSGKTYRQKMGAAIYNERLSLVTQREGGVGSIDESLDQQLIAGRPFIQFDNFRGRFASTHLEAFMTAEGSFPCRVPYKGEVTVPPENYFICVTSNGVDTTRDFANRSNIIRIRKRPKDYLFAKYDEGDLLARVRYWQPYYLGCVFTVIREWHRQGKPRTNEPRHDFREWVQVLDWICQNIFRTVPIMDGHRQAQERVSDPNMIWLRSVVLEVAKIGALNVAMTATKLLEICEENDITIPRLRPGADQEQGKKTIGIIMGKLFGIQNILDVEDFQTTREETYVDRPNGSDGGSFKSKTYTVTRK